MNEFIHGIPSAVVTPFDDGERFDAAAFERLLERLYAQGSSRRLCLRQHGRGSCNRWHSENRSLKRLCAVRRKANR